MQRKNIQTESANTLPAPVSPKPSLVELAQTNKANRTGHAKVLSDRDIPALPDVSIIGNFDDGLPNVKNANSELSPADERRWRSEAQALKQRLTAAREKKDKASGQCVRAKNSVIHQTRRRKGEIFILQVKAVPDECLQAEEKAETLTRVEQEWNDFCERARHAGVPWAWIE